MTGAPHTEAQDHATQWLWTYNNDRPNMGIGGITPAMKLLPKGREASKWPHKFYDPTPLKMGGLPAKAIPSHTICKRAALLKLRS